VTIGGNADGVQRNSYIAGLYCYYHRLLQVYTGLDPVHSKGSVRCSAFTKCLKLIPLHEDICNDYGFFETGTETQLVPPSAGVPAHQPYNLYFLVLPGTHRTIGDFAYRDPART
jgi:hypothetical protein